MLRRKILFLFILIVIFSSSTCTNIDRSVDLPPFDGSLFFDMFLPHEGLPAGVPDDYGWKKRPIIGAGANVPLGWNVITAWGTVYADQDLPDPDKKFSDIRVHVKDLRLYILRNNGKWDLIQDVKTPIGYWYLEDFDNDTHIDSDFIEEDGGGISVHAGSGFCFHFFPVFWEQIFRSNVKAILVVCQARLIGTENYDDPTPKYLIGVGADYWRSMNCEIIAANNWVVGIGRLKYITPEWQYFIMHTFSRKEANMFDLPIENE